MFFFLDARPKNQKKAFLNSPHPTRRVRVRTHCRTTSYCIPADWYADWCLQSDGVSDSTLQAQSAGTGMACLSDKLI